jgi:hypothetical protein
MIPAHHGLIDSDQLGIEVSGCLDALASGINAQVPIRCILATLPEKIDTPSLCVIARFRIDPKDQPCRMLGWCSAAPVESLEATG